MTPSLSNPSKTRPSPSLAIFAAVVGGAVVVGIAAVVFFFNPSTHGFYPVCAFHQMTGLNCPGCGATRSFYALLHGQFRLALRDNALFVVVLAGIGLRTAWYVSTRRMGRPAGKFAPTPVLWGLLVVTIIFSLLRNLPAFAFLSP